MTERDDLGPWHLAVNKTIEAMNATTDVAVLTGNHAPEPREALEHLRTVLMILTACRERERLARNRIASARP
jgi:hypothetical protein